VTTHVEHITEPTAEFPMGSECPVHHRVHSSHGWYVCIPAERCPHGTVETATTKCRDCLRERAL
jgi:hypothetical protein